MFLSTGVLLPMSWYYRKTCLKKDTCPRAELLEGKQLFQRTILPYRILRRETTFIWRHMSSDQILERETSFVDNTCPPTALFHKTTFVLLENMSSYQFSRGTNDSLSTKYPNLSCLARSD